MNDIHFIITGGTIDSVYHPPTETSVPSDQSSIPGFIHDAVMPYEGYSFDTLCMLDSGDITDDHRAEMAGIIKETAAQKIIITHGTNTLTDTARFLQSALEGVDKTVILTGAMIPLKQFVMSDGGFNLGYAVAQAQSLDSGVYICMHAKIFAPDAVTKNRALARFEEI